MKRLSDDEIDERLSGGSWRREGDTIVRDVELGDFAAAIALVNAVAVLAEQANHHPDLLVYGYKRVRLTLTTHSAGGVTALDLALADAVDALE
jgi:4a-hydroxytetrahydrobiopterin dehydratase